MIGKKQRVDIIEVRIVEDRKLFERIWLKICIGVVHHEIMRIPICKN